MHVSEGLLPGSVVIAGGVAALAALAAGLRAMPPERTPRTAMLAAVFFVTSLIHVPFGVASVHLLLNGLAGILLGGAIFPALAVALFLQALLFQFGGLTVWGVNLLIMAMPGLMAYHGFHMVWRRRRTPGCAFWLGVVWGGASVLGSALLLAGTLALAGGRGFLPAAATMLAANLPVVVADGLVTGAALSFLCRVQPAMLEEAGAS